MSKYKEAGVDLDKSNVFTSRVRARAIRTLNPLVLAHVDGFAGCFQIPEGYKNPVLVTGADGVGTKLKLAIDNPQYLLNVGQDLVAMVINDIICCGAKPLFFLDYFAAGSLNVEQGSTFIDGVADACCDCGAVLIGGETAEMPGMYQPGDFDAAGFGVGVVEKDNMINGQFTVGHGDMIIGIESSGPHSNGYSLIRKILNDNVYDQSLLEAIMKPTRLYSSAVQKVSEQVSIHGIANITGGGFIENIPRVVHPRFQSRINLGTWAIPEVFNELQQLGKVEDNEMYRVFNMGIGMVFIVDHRDTNLTLDILKSSGFNSWPIGTVIDNSTGDCSKRIVIS